VKKLVIGGASLALILSSTVAHGTEAPTLPAVDAMYEISCDAAINNWQLYALDLSALTRTAIGDGTGTTTGEECALQGALLPGTDWFYYPDNFQAFLMRVNVVTGGVEQVGAWGESIYSLAIDDEGNAYALTYDTLFSVNLETGALTELVEADTYGMDEGYPYGFAYDPKTDKFYMAEDGEDSLYTLNISTGEFTFVADQDAYFLGSIAFDSDGYLWTNDGQVSALVRRVPLSGFGDAPAWEETATMTPSVASESLIIARGEPVDSDAESLATTGSIDPLPLVAFGAMLAGTAAVIRRRSA
jgi:hypothetical protein